MESTLEPGHYRFGGIGAMNGQANTPIRRLGQCTTINDGTIRSQWIYVAMIELSSKTSAEHIRKIEKVVRDHLFKHPGSYINERCLKKDALKEIKNSPALIREFKKAVKSICFRIQPQTL